MYTPPFKITARAINLIAEISAMVERFAIRMERDDALLLRKINRIKTIQGSLAIEGNTLTESQITDIIDGKLGNELSSFITQENAREITQEKILSAIRNNPRITRRELAVLLGRTEDSVKYQLQKLTRQGIIKHIGATKAGEWIIIG